ncbi:hypothetical protein SFBM_0219 [Candidatus Arthromitus sp. SFB-mouse-Japan]|uniref:hypothetical protein n=1 Tax=unclassified Candidatus Neoarthromitus TaxID=2638829 RepID=UPI00021B7CDC|nr:Hypothetical protein SFBmNL_00231 [Candidatus Arthromitus sp. SFB-mouse-NL]EIA22673.1 hypothetical protein SFB1_263G7 [Candidatus Arthromitus sp. SFB-1]EIA22953.1 hypothetical protein SFB3_326G18 [Candidatus Arthromitus sp. SFB-3]EIA25368.1 hypothetical protein SFB2_014G1 [Candidatus Arthromitus sp. SFB-2]EIA28378.1 hypothetical protein SFB6_051G1 [Candidatus Arthromitus sp. SFB-co]EIA29833.1 hypothetical protein SFB5_050G10 [Candidatus Arthromitus sp. SFB-5]EIA31188.1 hypothetical protein
MSTYLFNNKRDRETNKLMGVVIFLILSLVFTIVISLSIFLVYFDDYMSIQKQYSILEERLQRINVENYERNSYYNRLNDELNQAKNEVNKLTLEKDISDKNIKLVEYFINAVNSGNSKDINRFLDVSKSNLFTIPKNYTFPTGMEPGRFVLNDDLESGSVTYFYTQTGQRTDKYVFNMILKNDIWYVENFELIEYTFEKEFLEY